MFRGTGAVYIAVYMLFQVPGHRASFCKTVMVLPVLQGRGKYPYHRQQDGALPARLPAQDFLCQTDVEEVNGAAPAQVREPHPPGPLNTEAPGDFLCSFPQSF